MSASMHWRNSKSFGPESQSGLKKKVLELIAYPECLEAQKHRHRDENEGLNHCHGSGLARCSSRLPRGPAKQHPFNGAAQKDCAPHGRSERLKRPQGLGRFHPDHGAHQRPSVVDVLRGEELAYPEKKGVEHHGLKPLLEECARQKFGNRFDPAASSFGPPHDSNQEAPHHIIPARAVPKADECE